jgi:hypothetical protein
LLNIFYFFFELHWFPFALIMPLFFSFFVLFYLLFQTTAIIILQYYFLRTVPMATSCYLLFENHVLRFMSTDILLLPGPLSRQALFPWGMDNFLLLLLRMFIKASKYRCPFSTLQSCWDDGDGPKWIRVVLNTELTFNKLNRRGYNNNTIIIVFWMYLSHLRLKSNKEFLIVFCLYSPGYSWSKWVMVWGKTLLKSL